ncbi:MAG: ABC transporter ATP-binding protein [Lactobacillus sp.]|uniref:ABC transporter ATP-binding protein n=1 Tax=Limosilactobacillus agrestis TaxID=2759748 RepID=UPI0015F863B8|nr:ABC transporter ATP-binding protein [Limosilactobacillus agrestis]MBD5090806.1 ABC transporter ATP-binding protein [Lactobacillus sp.]MBB1100218.1 ABC transporter ATP-binding protein [Limosilactobacillus agrestis]MCD7112715.1 ABC transporter ATP-binding protein [Limosilactobacillus agrestis]MCD7120699.1 ABC transporter ATP-binding protein [Limosilactobacillus agrestis]MCD7126442.1 ABC transporter ATP-binding protein [Limosilactobacillus agrestis]
MLITTHNLTKKYGNKLAVDDLNLKIPQGALVAYLGTNGAGKSTTIKMLTGLIEPTSGVIKTQAGLKIGIVFQQSVLDKDLTVRENLIGRAKMYKQVDEEWVDQLIVMIGLSNFVNQRYGTLSGGQKRRVDIARALLNHPTLLFLDEPTTGLDIQTRNVIWKLLKKLQNEQGLTIFLTTHYLEEADGADLIYVLENGHVLAEGSAEELRQKYAANQLRLVFERKVEFTEGIKINNKEYVLKNVPLAETIKLVNKYADNLSTFEYREGNLDDVFIAITGKELQ